MEMNELIARYGFHPATTEARVKAHQMIREQFLHTASFIEGLLPSGCREKQLCHTALQEASMWANAAVAIHTVDKVEDQIAFRKSHAADS